MAEQIENHRAGSRGRGNPNWIKGISGNPNGKPKKEYCITSWLKEYSTQLISAPIDPKKLTYAQAAALSAWKAAAKGELDNYNFIIERIEGKVKDHPLEVHLQVTPQELTDAELATICATNILKNNTRNGSDRAIETEAGKTQAY